MCAPPMVARETQNAEPLTLILVMQRHQPVILRREPTLRGYVDDQQDITSISTQRLRGAIETTNNKLIGKHEYLHALLRQTTVRGPVIVPRLLYQSKPRYRGESGSSIHTRVIRQLPLKPYAKLHTGF